MTTCSHVHNSSPPAQAVSTALSAAEAKCIAQGERWTPSRRRTYELLLEAGTPVKAYDLLSSYAPEGEPAAKPPTIYRALDFLLAHGLVHRIESLNAFVACTADGAHSAEFLICDCCGRVEELGLGVDRAAVVAAADRGFRPTRVVLEVHGLCADCG
jgi:Fur family transcriptional regulator, zinc uptake regulator